jgi:SHS2 domain-containing protein
MYEFFEHTADLGIRVQAPDLNSLFAEAARALFAALVENPDSVQPVQQVDLRLPADETAYLLFDWLRELLYRFEVEHLLFSKFEVKVNDAGLQAIACGEPIDRSRHELAHEVKAITYHGLQVERTNDGWIAEIIVDI